MLLKCRKFLFYFFKLYLLHSTCQLIYLRHFAAIMDFKLLPRIRACSQFAIPFVKATEKHNPFLNPISNRKLSDLHL